LILFGSVTSIFTFSKYLLTKSDGLWHPMGLAITRNGHFLVTEALGKVRVYRYI
jgi:hypothetical protein